MKPKFGVYISRTGNLKVLELSRDRKMWIVDSGIIKRHPFLKLKVHVVQECSIGFPLFDIFGPLKNCEYLGEL
jgi:hypothetical protein